MRNIHTINILKFLILLFLILFLIGSSLFMQTTNAQERVSYGNINLDFDEKNETISVIEGYTLENVGETNLTQLAFHLPSQVDYSTCSVNINDTPSQSYSHFGRMLIINLSKPILAQEKVNLLITYTIKNSVIDNNAIFEKTLTYNTSMLIINLTLPKNWKVKYSTETFTENEDGILLSMPPLINKKKGYEIYISFEKTENKSSQEVGFEYYLIPYIILIFAVSFLIASFFFFRTKIKTKNKEEKRISEKGPKKKSKKPNKNRTENPTENNPNKLKLRKIKETIHNLDVSYQKGKLDKETYTKLREEYKEKALELMSK